MEKKITILSLLIFLFCYNGISQLLAFPGAEGAGKFVSGGRGSAVLTPAVYEVTNLGDVNSPGSLRYAATVSGPSSRIIVFRVAGTIHLNSTLTFNRANTTIAGQTAPGEGICIADYPVYIGADNMIIRYIRFRLGDKNQNGGMVNGSGDGDAFGDNGSGRKNLIIDHCTASWSDDEALTIYKGDNVTIQWCMITEPLNFSYHFETGDPNFEQHAYGGIWGGKHASFHHNLFAHIKGRGPRFDGIRNIPGDTGDFRNNIIYNWSDYNTNGGEGGTYNIVNNYYKYGPSVQSGGINGVDKRSMLINPYKSATIPYGRYYLTGNYCDYDPAVTNRNWLGAAFNSAGSNLNDSIGSKVSTPFTCIDINMQTAADAYNSVLSNAGCFLPHRDTLDQRIMNDVINRTGRIIDVQGGYPHGTSYTISQSAWPTLAPGTSPVDTDHDGMPDVWEDQRGLNKNSNSDLNNYTSTTGYSNVESYLNGDTIVAPGLLNSCITARSFASINSGTWINANDTTYSDYLSAAYLSSTDTNNIVASVLDNANFGTFNASYYTTNTLRFDPLTTKPVLNRNITITPANASLITSPVTVRIYFSNTEFNALKAADPSIITINDLTILKSAVDVCGSALPAAYSIVTPTASGVFGSYQNGYYLQFQTTSFSTFFIGSKTSFPVPLKLISFSAVLQNKKVNTKWIIQNEINTKAFNVERSEDGINFYAVGNITANNSAGTNIYSFTDVSPLSGISYYRLKMIDFDGKFSYSNTIPVNNTTVKSLSVSPDPATSVIKINYPTTAADAVLQIAGSDGKKLISRKLNAATSEVIINISSLTKGFYEIIYNNKKQIQTIKFLKN